jgi:UDP-N-acetylmuramoyl-tripeptide--D-alanyl-D-alanine ligase
MHTPHKKINIFLPFLGYQNVSNALAASTLAYALRIPLNTIKIGLSNTSITSGRLEIIQLQPNKILINDTYNSNVASMITAMKILEKMPGYKILVTGDMAELGKDSILYHKMIGNAANLCKINKIFSIGKNSHEISKIFFNGNHFLKKTQLKNSLKEIVLQKKKLLFL